MRQEQFEALHAKLWTGFETWLCFMQKPVISRKNIDPKTLPFPMAQAPRRYRQICLHLSLAQDRNFSLTLVSKLHRMAQEGHDALYGARTGFVRRAVAYMGGGFAADVRANWKWVLASAILFFGPYITMMIVIRIWPTFVFNVFPYEHLLQMRHMYGDSYNAIGISQADSRFEMFGFYIFNNVGIAFRCFAGGFMLGLGTIISLLFNGVFIGATEADLVTQGLGHNFYSFTVGHSSFELGAIILSGATGLKLGMSLLIPGLRTRAEALKHTGKSIIGIVCGSSVMLFCAALIEAFWSPLVLPLSIKLSVGGALMLLVLSYFAFAGRRYDTNAFAPYLEHSSVRIEDLALVLRPRSNFEAIDLGIRMGGFWGRALYTTWLGIVFPIVALILGVLAFGLGKNIWALFLIWWLKPLFDRIALHVISHAAFGDLPTIRSTLASLPRLLRTTRLLRALTIGRLSLRRSLVLPIDQLESLKGAAASNRRSLIGARTNACALTQTFVWWLIVFCLWIGSLGLLAMFVPETIIEGSSSPEIIMHIIKKTFMESNSSYWSYFLTLWVMCDLLLEPLYIAGGFALYLKRRTDLEAWDIEVQFRQITQEGSLERIVSNVTRNLAFAVCLLALCGTALMSTPVRAVEREKAAQNASATLTQLMKQPEFGEEKTHKVAYLKTDKNPPGVEETPSTAEHDSVFKPLIETIANSVRVIAWILIAMIAAALIYIIARNFGVWRSADNYVPPAEIAGLDIRPESIPDDVAGTAFALAKKGEHRTALSLLFRATLSILANRDHVFFVRGDTEEDCVLRVAQCGNARVMSYFRRLADTWQNLAYAHSTIDLSHIEELCLDWRATFSNKKRGEA